MLRSLVAIGALNKSVKMSHAASVQPELRDANQRIASLHREFALATYDKAICGMRQIVPSGDNSTFLRKALIACLLVHCIESCLQDLNTAYFQAQVGYELLHKWIAEHPHKETGIGSPNSNIIEDDIFSEFARQDLHGAMRWGDKKLELHQARRLEGTDTIMNMPLVFSSLEEARRYAELVLRRTFHLMSEAFACIIAVKVESGHAYTADTPGELVDPCHVPETLLEDRDTYLRDIRRWRHAFRPVFDSSILSADPENAGAAALFRIRALDAEIVLAGAFFTDECSFDRYPPEFREIIALSRIFIQKRKQTTPRFEPIFNLENGIENGLQSVGMYCRDKNLRHEALYLLRSQAYLDATKYTCRMAIRVAYHIGLEEEGRRADGSIPESARYHRNWCLNHWFEKSQDVTLIYARRLCYPLGKSYPAKREWKQRTFTQAEIEDMVEAENYECPPGRGKFDVWPAGIRKPNSVKWTEVHDELLRTVQRHSPD